MPPDAGRDLAAARRVLRGLPGFDDVARSARIARLGGLTNRVFRIDAGAVTYCLRLPGAGTRHYLDRVSEAENARKVAAAGIAPDVIHADADGTMVTRFVPDALALSPLGLRDSGASVERAATLLRRLHDTVPPFRNRFVLADYLGRYRAEVENAYPRALSGLRPGWDLAAQAVEALAARPTALKPSHCDLQPGNLLDSGQRMWLIDWEFSGQNDPAWDLAYFAVEAGLDEGREARWLGSYFSGEPPPLERAAFALAKPLVDLLAILWSLLAPRHGDHPTAMRDRQARTERFNSAAQGSRFAEHLSALRRG